MSSETVRGSSSQRIIPEEKGLVVRLSDREQRIQKIVKVLQEDAEAQKKARASGLRFIATFLDWQLTLADLRAAGGTRGQQYLIEKLNLQPGIEELNKRFPFLERIQKISYEVLDQFPCDTLQDASEKSYMSAIEHAFITDEELIQVSLQDLENRSVQIFSLRLDQFFQERPDLLAQLAQTPFKLNPKMPAAKMRLASSDELAKASSKVPPETFAILSDEQVKTLDFSKLTAEETLACLGGGSGNKEWFQRRFPLLSPEQLHIAFKKVASLSRSIAHCVPISCFPHLSFSKMTKDELEDLLCWPVLSNKEKKARVAAVPQEAIKTILSKVGDEVKKLFKQ